MTKEEGWSMYTQVHGLHRRDLNKSQIARRLEISRPIVYEYLNMTPDEFELRFLTMGQRAKTNTVC